MLLAVIASFLSGVARTVSRMANAQLSERIGAFQSTFFNYVVGLIVSVAALEVSGERSQVSTLAGGEVPVWAYFGGVVGVLFVVLSNLTAPRMSAFVIRKASAPRLAPN